MSEMRSAWEWQEDAKIFHRRRMRAGRNGRTDRFEEQNFVRPQRRSRAKNGHRYLDTWLSPKK